MWSIAAYFQDQESSPLFKESIKLTYIVWSIHDFFVELFSKTIPCLYNFPTTFMYCIFETSKYVYKLYLYIFC